MEIKSVFFALNTDSAPGSYGFGGSFYHSCLDIIFVDLRIAVKQFFVQSWILPELNSNIISLISKVQGVVVVKDFRPIVVTNIKFKVISKILQ